MSGPPTPDPDGAGGGGYSFANARRWRGVFFLTIVLRTYLSIALSYIHPDEHFQGPEAIACM
jgi:hypothetical protein